MTDNKLTEQSEMQTCPCCGTQKWRVVPYLPDISYLCCNECHYHIQSRINQENRVELFEEEQSKFYDEDSVVLSSGFSPLTDEIKKRRLVTIEKFLPKGSAIIEVGPGSGEILAQLSETGYKTFGSEHSKSLAEHLRRLDNVHIFEGDFAEQDYQSEIFDAYCSFHVIEHVIDFERHFAQAKHCVKAGGLAFIATPNASGWEQRLPFRLSPNNDSSHFQLFSREALTKVLMERGWTIIDVQTPSYAINWLRIITKILRRIRRQDENLTGGEYAKTAGGSVAKAVRIFGVITAPFRKIQEAMLSGNEVFIVARKDG